MRLFTALLVLAFAPLSAHAGGRPWSVSGEACDICLLSKCDDPADAFLGQAWGDLWDSPERLTGCVGYVNCTITQACPPLCQTSYTSGSESDTELTQCRNNPCTDRCEAERPIPADVPGGDIERVEACQAREIAFGECLFRECATECPQDRRGPAAARSPCWTPVTWMLLPGGVRGTFRQTVSGVGRPRTERLTEAWQKDGDSGYVVETRWPTAATSIHWQCNEQGLLMLDAADLMLGGMPAIDIRYTARSAIGVTLPRLLSTGASWSASYDFDGQSSGALGSQLKVRLTLQVDQRMLGVEARQSLGKPWLTAKIARTVRGNITSFDTRGEPMGPPQAFSLTATDWYDVMKGTGLVANEETFQMGNIRGTRKLVRTGLSIEGLEGLTPRGP